MYFGELAEQNTNYQGGHSTGSVRAFDSAISHFEMIAKEDEKKIMKQKFSADEVANMLKNCKEEWLHHCDTFGMGVEEN